MKYLDYRIVNGRRWSFIIYPLILCLIFFSYLHFSNHHRFLKPSPEKSVFKIKLFNDWNELETWQLDRSLSVLPTKMIRSVKSIALIDNINHYGDASTKGHCYPTRQICLKSDELLDPATIQHEVAHTYLFYIEKRTPEFRKKWQLIAGDVYNRNFRSFPTDGLWCSHGDTLSVPDYHEDVAYWVETLYQICFDPKNSVARFYLTKNRDHLDPRYRAKLELLYEYRFITDGVYNKSQIYFE